MYIQFSLKKWNLNQNTPGEKSSSQELKKSRMKKMWNRIRLPRPPAVDEIKIFDTDDNVAKCSTFCDLVIIIKKFMKLKFLIMMTRSQIVECFATLSSLQECFATLSSLSKILISSTAEGLGRPIRFHIFFIPAFFSSWPLLFLHQRCFGWDSR